MCEPMILSKRDRKTLDEIDARYHQGGLKDLPPVVYFDVGQLVGIIMRLVNQIEGQREPPIFTTPPDTH